MIVDTSFLPAAIMLGNMMYTRTFEDFSLDDVTLEGEPRRLQGDLMKFCNTSVFEDNETGNVLYFEETGFDDTKLNSRPEYAIYRLYDEVIQDMCRLSECLENTTFIITRDETQPMSKVLVFMNGGVREYFAVHELINDAQKMVPDYNYAYMKNGIAEERLVIRKPVNFDEIGII